MEYRKETVPKEPSSHLVILPAFRPHSAFRAINRIELANRLLRVGDEPFVHWQLCTFLRSSKQPSWLKNSRLLRGLGTCCLSFSCINPSCTLKFWFLLSADRFTLFHIHRLFAIDADFEVSQIVSRKCPI